jgi:hypothetical protein
VLSDTIHLDLAHSNNLGKFPLLERYLQVGCQIKSQDEKNARHR